jgi:hypothetical protein
MKKNLDKPLPVVGKAPAVFPFSLKLSVDLKTKKISKASCPFESDSFF